MYRPRGCDENRMSDIERGHPRRTGLLDPVMLITVIGGDKR